MTTFIETLPHAGGFLIQEGNGDISREVITIASGAGKLRTAAVLGRVTASKKYAPLDPAANDGSQNAAAILFRDADATSADAEATGIVRLATVTAAELVWPAGITDAQKAAALASLATTFIIAR